MVRELYVSLQTKTNHEHDALQAGDLKSVVELHTKPSMQHKVSANSIPKSDASLRPGPRVNSVMSKTSDTRRCVAVKRCSHCASSLHFVQHVTIIPSESTVSDSEPVEVADDVDDVAREQIAGVVHLLKDEDFPTDIITHKQIQHEKCSDLTDFGSRRLLLFRYVLALGICVYAAGVSCFVIGNCLTCLEKTASEIVILYSLTFLLSVFVVMPISSCVLALIAKYCN